MDSVSLLPTFGNFAFTMLAFVMALSVIVAIHEYGHYIVGRWTGIKAEVFSIGFGKVLLSKTDKHGTVWQIAALPFGGYVKFLGDKNAASVGGTEEVAEVDPRHTMMGAPLWARSLTVAAGPVFNFILSIIVFSGYIMWQGQPSEDLIVTSNYDLPPQLVNELQPGDRIIAVQDMVFGEDGLNVDLLPRQPSFDYTVIRDGAEMIVQGPHPIVPRVDSLTPRSAADDEGFRVGDVVVAVEGAPIYAFNELVAAVVKAEGAPITMDVWRAGEVTTVTFAARETDEPRADGEFERVWRLGIGGTFFFDEATDPVGPWEALKLGTQRLWFTLKLSLNALGKVVTGGISTCNLSGPVGIAQASGSMAEQGAQSYVLFIGMLSAAVGLLNLFPVPILDGGHLVFHAYEAVTRRKPSDRALNILMFAGLALIASLMIFAVLNDLLLCP